VALREVFDQWDRRHVAHNGDKCEHRAEEELLLKPANPDCQKGFLRKIGCET
jgi:hypothetical protein